MSAYEDAINVARDGLDDQYERNGKVDRACADAPSS